MKLQKKTGIFKNKTIIINIQVNQRQFNEMAASKQKLKKKTIRRQTKTTNFFETKMVLNNKKKFRLAKLNFKTNFK